MKNMEKRIENKSEQSRHSFDEIHEECRTAFKNLFAWEPSLSEWQLLNQIIREVADYQNNIEQQYRKKLTDGTDSEERRNFLDYGYL